MADIVNLRRVRMARKRREAQAAADENRVTFGLGKAERELSLAERELAAKRLAGHLRSTSDDGSDPPS